MITITTVIIIDNFKLIVRNSYNNNNYYQEEIVVDSYYFINHSPTSPSKITNLINVITMRDIMAKITSKNMLGHLFNN